MTRDFIVDGGSMAQDFIVGGVVLSPLVPDLLLAALVTGLLTFVLMRLNFYRLVWRRPLVELAIFCIILGAVVSLTPDGWPIWPIRAPLGASR